MAKRMRKTRRKVSIRNKIGATVRGRIMAAKLGPTAGYEGYETVNEMVDVADKPEPKGRARKAAKVTASKAEKLTPTQFAKKWKAERTKAVAGDKQAAENLAQLRKTGIEQGILSPDGKRLNSHSDKKKAARAAKTEAKTRRAHNRANASVDDIYAARADQRPRDYWESVDADTMRKEQNAKEEIDSLRDLDEKGIAELRESTAAQMKEIVNKINYGQATAADDNELDELTHFAYALDAATLRENGFDPFDPDNTPEWTLTENFSALNDQDLQRIENNPFLPGWQRDLASEELEHRQPWRDGGILQSMLKDASITELRATQAMFMGDDAQYTNAELRQLAAKTGNARYAYDSDTFDTDYAAWLENITGEKLDPETFKKLNAIGGKPTPEQQTIIDKLGYIPNRANYARTLRNEPVNTTTGKPRTHRDGQPEPDGYDTNLEALYGKDTINATADEINNIQAMDTDQVETELTAAINNLKQWGHPPQFADVHDEYQFDRALHHAFMLDAEAHARRNQNTDTGEPNPFHDEPPAFGDATADNFDPFDDALLAEKERARLAEIDSDELETLAADASANGNTQYSDFIWDELQHRNPEIEGGEIDQALPYAGIRELTALYKKWAPETPIDNAFKERVKEQAARRGNDRYRNHPAAQEEYDNWLDTVLNVDDGKGGKINIRDGLYMGDKTDPNGGGLYKDANGNFKPVTLSFEEAITNDMMAVQLGEEISRAIEENIGFLPNQTNFMKMVRGERPKQFRYSPDERRDMATMGGRKSRPKTVKEKLEKEKAEAKNTGATNTPDAADKPRKATPDAPETPEATNLKKRLEEATRAENQRHKDNAEARKQQGTAEVQQGEQLKENGEIVRDAAIIYPRDNGTYAVKPYTPTGQGDKRAPNGKGHPAKDIEEARELADTITAMVGMSDADIRAAIDGDDKRRAEMAIAERDRRAALNKADGKATDAKAGAKATDGKATTGKERADKPATPNKDTAKDTEKASTAAAKRNTTKDTTTKPATTKPQAKKEDTGNKETKRTTTTSAKPDTAKPAKTKPGNTETAKKPEQAKPKQDTKPAAHKRGEPFTEQHLQDGETITDTGSIQRGDFTIISSADGYRIMEQFDSHRMTKPMKKTLAKVRADVDRKQAERTQSEANKKAKAQPVTYNKADGKKPATPAKPAVKPVSQAERNKTAKLDAALKAAIRQDTTGNTKKQAHKLVADRLGISGATTQEDFTKRVNEYIDANGELTTLEENALIDYAVKNKLSTRDNNGMPIYLRDNAQRTAEEERRLTRAAAGKSARARKTPTGTRELSVNHRPTKAEIAEAIRTLNAKPETKEVKKPATTTTAKTGKKQAESKPANKPQINPFTGETVPTYATPTAEQKKKLKRLHELENAPIGAAGRAEKRELKRELFAANVDTRPDFQKEIDAVNMAYKPTKAEKNPNNDGLYANEAGMWNKKANRGMNSRHWDVGTTELAEKDQLLMSIDGKEIVIKKVHVQRNGKIVYTGTDLATGDTWEHKTESSGLVTKPHTLRERIGASHMAGAYSQEVKTVPQYKAFLEVEKKYPRQEGSEKREKRESAWIEAKREIAINEIAKNPAKDTAPTVTDKQVEQWANKSAVKPDTPGAVESFLDETGKWRTDIPHSYPMHSVKNNATGEYLTSSGSLFTSKLDDAESIEAKLTNEDSYLVTKNGFMRPEKVQRFGYGFKVTGTDELGNKAEVKLPFGTANHPEVWKPLRHKDGTPYSKDEAAEHANIKAVLEKAADEKRAFTTNRVVRGYLFEEEAAQRRIALANKKPDGKAPQAKASATPTKRGGAAKPQATKATPKTKRASANKPATKTTRRKATRKTTPARNTSTKEVSYTTPTITSTGTGDIKPRKGTFTPQEEALISTALKGGYITKNDRAKLAESGKLTRTQISALTKEAVDNDNIYKTRGEQLKNFAAKMGELANTTPKTPQEWITWHTAQNDLKTSFEEFVKETNKDIRKTRASSSGGIGFRNTSFQATGDYQSAVLKAGSKFNSRNDAHPSWTSFIAKLAKANDNTPGKYDELTKTVMAVDMGAATDEDYANLRKQVLAAPELVPYSHAKSGIFFKEWTGDNGAIHNALTAQENATRATPVEKLDNFKRRTDGLTENQLKDQAAKYVAHAKANMPDDWANYDRTQEDIKTRKQTPEALNSQLENVLNAGGAAREVIQPRIDELRATMKKEVDEANQGYKDGEIDLDTASQRVAAAKENYTDAVIDALSETFPETFNKNNRLAVLSAKGDVEGQAFTKHAGKGEATAQRKEFVSEVGSAYPTAWVDARNQQGIRVFNENKRAYANSMGYIAIQRDDTRGTAIHEVGHLMQDVIPGLSDLEAAYKIKRATKNSVGNPEEYSMNWGERSFKSDTDLHPYTLKTYREQYESHYRMKLTERDALAEVITVGMQALFDPYMFDTLDKADILDFTLGAMLTLNGKMNGKA